MSRESAAPAPGVTGAEQTTGESNAATTSTVPETTAVDILQYAGVPEEVVKALSQRTEDGEPRTEEKQSEEQPKAEQEQPELPKQEQEQEAKEEPVETDDAGSEEENALEMEGAKEIAPVNEELDAEEQEPEGEKPSWYEKRVSKWGRQKQRLQDEIDDLREQIAGKQKTEDRGQRTEGRPPDTLSQVTNFEELKEVVKTQRAVRDWCMDNPDGMVMAEGTPNEKVISPEEVRKTLIGATRIIEDAPEREKELQKEVQDQHTRAQWHEIANLEWPELFDKQSEIYQTSQQFLKQYPEIDQNPNRDFLLGLMVEGWKPFQARMIARQQAAQNGGPKTEGGGQNGQKKESLPEALKRKIPPIPKNAAPNPPRGSRRSSPQDEAAAAVQRLAREGGSPEAAQAAIAAIERQNAMSGDTKRMPAPI